MPNKQAPRLLTLTPHHTRTHTHTHKPQGLIRTHPPVYQFCRFKNLFLVHLQYSWGSSLSIKTHFLFTVFFWFVQLVSFKPEQTCLTTKLQYDCNALVSWTLIWNDYKKNPIHCNFRVDISRKKFWNYTFSGLGFSWEESINVSGRKFKLGDKDKCVMLCAIWYHLYNLKNVKKNHGGVLLIVKLQTSVYHFTKSNTPP